MEAKTKQNKVRNSRTSADILVQGALNDPVYGDFYLPWHNFWLMVRRDEPISLYFETSDNDGLTTKSNIEAYGDLEDMEIDRPGFKLVIKNGKLLRLFIDEESMEKDFSFRRGGYIELMNKVTKWV